MDDNLSELSFEPAFEELQQVLEELRGDAMTLDRSIALFERGNLLAEHCNALLTTAELRVTQVTPDGIAEQGIEPLDIDTDW